MQRLIILLFGVATYAVFFATFVYFIVFVGNLQLTPLVDAVPFLEQVPHSLDAGKDGATFIAVSVNLLLILLFGMQHSIMARSGFKSWLHNLLPPAAERSVYVLMASLVLALLMWQWRPIPEVLWQAESAWAVTLGWTVYAAGFGMVFLSTFLIDHFDLFGLRQVWSQFLGVKPVPPQFKTPFLYRLVRHPLYLGFVLAFWGGPLMTAGHFLFAIGMSAYILIAIQLEERDLVRFHGPVYEKYRERVPMLIPVPGRKME